jgi:AbrB family looped-hinge helix DNA binding protein
MNAYFYPNAVKPEKEDTMLVTIDKRGSINLPASLRKDLGVGPGTHLELTVDAGGAIVLFPVEIYRTVRLTDAGLAKLDEARASERDPLPQWFQAELDDARADTEQEIPR